MKLRRVCFPLLVTFLAVILSLAFSNSAFASIHAPRTTQTPVDTGQKSQANPALTDYNSALYVAYTGLDPAHHINIISSTSPTTPGSFSGPVTLTDTTPNSEGPSLATFQGHLYVAWMGTGTPYLYIGYFNGSTHLVNHTTLPDSSPHRPSIAGYGGALYISWLGTDGKLNIESSTDGVHFGNKYTFSDTSDRTPSLASFTNSFGNSLNYVERNKP